MPRRSPLLPIPLPLRARVRLPLWSYLRRAAEPATVVELYVALSAPTRSIRTQLEAWHRAGLVTKDGGTPRRYRLTDAARGEGRPPEQSRAGAMRARRPSQRQSLWAAMRVLKRFDMPTLLIASGASRRSTADFVSSLLMVGYLRLVRARDRRAGTCALYVLALDTGPVAPCVTYDQADWQRKIVIDGNDDSRRTHLAARRGDREAGDER